MAESFGVFLVVSVSQETKDEKSSKNSGKCRAFSEQDFRVFINPWFAKPMVCVRVAFTKTTEITKTTKTTNTTQTATNKELSAGFAEITETTEMTKTTGIQGANHRFPKTKTTGIQGANHGFPKPRV